LKPRFHSAWAALPRLKPINSGCRYSYREKEYNSLKSFSVQNKTQGRTSTMPDTENLFQPLKVYLWQPLQAYSSPSLYLHIGFITNNYSSTPKICQRVGPVALIPWPE
jgi:hypothetical protein